MLKKPTVSEYEFDKDLIPHTEYTFYCVILSWDISTDKNLSGIKKRKEKGKEKKKKTKQIKEIHKGKKKEMKKTEREEKN